MRVKCFRSERYSDTNWNCPRSRPAREFHIFQVETRPLRILLQRRTLAPRYFTICLRFGICYFAGITAYSFPQVFPLPAAGYCCPVVGSLISHWPPTFRKADDAVKREYALATPLPPRPRKVLNLFELFLYAVVILWVLFGNWKTKRYFFRKKSNEERSTFQMAKI